MLRGYRLLNKNIIAIEISILFITTIITPVTLGDNTLKNQSNDDNYNRYLYPENYDCYSFEEINGYVEYQDVELSAIYKPVESTNPLDDHMMESPWPMYCHDVRHTGRSPYSTVNNSGYEKWQISLNTWVGGSSVIDNNGIIYIGSHTLYAIYPNGTLKWKFDGYIRTVSASTIDENGIVYVGSIWADPNYLFAIYTSNGTLKWKFKTDNNIYSSPAIGNDGTVYFGCDDHYIYALNQNGNLNWKYKTGDYVLSSPAIGQDGTIYCGSHDNHLYALYPNNGTLKWKYKTGYWVRVSPCIADDDTIYIVSLDNHLHAVNPNGTLKWKTNMGEGGTSPTIGQDGTIYCGYTKLHAVNPVNGTIKWRFNVGGKIRGATPCNSIDGTIYLGNYDGSDIIAVNPDGTEKWRKSIGGDVESAPAIGKDGTVYIGDGKDDGYLHAFGPLDLDAPSAPYIDGPRSGRVGIEYDFTFKSISPLDRDLYYWIEWGDGDKIGWRGPYSSGEEITESHTWSDQGTYTVKARAKDTDNLLGPWSEFEITIPRTRVIASSFFPRFLDVFLVMERLLNLLR